MTGWESLAQFGLPPLEKDLPEIRRLLEEDLERDRKDQEREDELARACCLQLFSVGHLEDVLTIWEAKQTGFDLSIAIDVQFLCGAGLEQTKAYLRQSDAPSATDALEYIEHCEACGDFEGFTPAKIIAWNQLT